MCFYRGRHEECKDFFSQDDGVVFCNDACSVMEFLCHGYSTDQWRLFINSSKASLKVVLLHKGNRFPSLPLVHAANMKEICENTLEMIKYEEFKWKLCGDLKVVALLLEMQHGYIKYCCFLCEWVSRDKKNHCVNKLWPNQISLTPGEKNVVSKPFVLPEIIYLPPLNKKLGLIKDFVKGMDKTGLDSNMLGIRSQI